MRTLIVCGILLAGAALVAQEAGVFTALKTTAALGKQAAGYYLVPTNQLLRPWGEQALIAGRPVDMAFDSQQRILAVLNWRSVLLLDGSTGTRLAEVRSRIDLLRRHRVSPRRPRTVGQRDHPQRAGLHPG